MEGDCDAGHTVWITVIADEDGPIRTTVRITTATTPWWGDQTSFSTNLGGPWDSNTPDFALGD